MWYTVTPQPRLQPYQQKKREMRVHQWDLGINQSILNCLYTVLMKFLSYRDVSASSLLTYYLVNNVLAHFVQHHQGCLLVAMQYAAQSLLKVSIII